MPRPARLPALALASLLATLPLASTRASAQSTRLPGPATAAQIEGYLGAAGLEGKARDQALLLHESYFERFRDFEDREVAPALEELRRDFNMTVSVEDARRDAATRRRLLSRAAQIDNQFVDEFLSSLTGDEQIRGERLRGALARRRAAALLPQFGTGSRVIGHDLRSSPAFATLEPAVRDAIAPALDAYDADLTRLVERAGQAAIDRSIRAAELRELRPVGGTPPVVEDGVEPDQAAVENWFRDMQLLQKEASQELVEAVARLRKLHRDTLLAIEPSLPSLAVFDLRAHLLSGAYPMILPRRPFGEVVAILRAKRDGGSMDDAAWASALDLVGAHESSMRGSLEALLAAADAVPERGDMMVFGNDGGEVETPEAARLARAQEVFLDADRRGADSLRTTLGLGEGSTQAGGRPPASIEINGAAIDLGDLLGGVGGGIDGGPVEGGSVQVVVGVAGMGGDGGEMIVLGGDELDDSGMVFMGMGGPGGGPRIPKPMSRETLDDVLAASGADAAMRPAFDALVEQLARERDEATKDLGSAQTGLGDEPGGMRFSITLADDGAVSPALSAQVAREAIARIEVSEEAFFDGVRAIAAGDRLDEVERARRVRARTRLVSGERGETAIDPVAVALVATIDEDDRAAALTALEGWDLSSVDALRGARRDLDALEDERTRLFEEATKTTSIEEGADGRQAASAISFDDGLGERMMDIDRRSKAVRDRIARANRDAIAAALDALGADTVAQRTLRRALHRELHPAVYARFGTLDATFAQARQLVADEALLVVLDTLEEEWRESREVRCEEAVADLEDRAREASRAGTEAPMADFASMQARMQERRRLRGDLVQLDAAIHRRVVDLVTGAVGAERAEDLPPAPGSRQGGRPMLRFGGQ
jgi:hypothetical protein